MNATNTQDPIDPRLVEALQQWNTFSAQNAKDALNTFEAITPLKDTAQINAQMLESLQDTDWQSVAQNMANPASFAKAYKELADIQMAAFSRWNNGFIEFMQTTLESGGQLSALKPDFDSPQQALAAYLETGLEIMQQYQEGANNQASDMNTIQSAYKAWLYKTLQDFSSPAKS